MKRYDDTVTVLFILQFFYLRFSIRIKVFSDDTKSHFTTKGSVVQRVDNANHWINSDPVKKCTLTEETTISLSGDLSDG